MKSEISPIPEFLRPPEYLSSKQAATLTGYSVSWFERKRWEGGGPPYIKRSGRVLYRSDELVAWVEELGRFHSTSEYVK